MTTLVQVGLILAGLYLVIGLLFAVPFVIAGVLRLDASAHGSTWGFRVIILPGVTALWPWLAWRWARGRPAREHNAHRDRAAMAGAEVTS